MSFFKARCISTKQKIRRNTQETSWRTLPRKDQLALLFLCRVFDFMQIASFQTICYYQLKSFDPSVSETTVSWQTGIAIGAFTAAQICTSVLWGTCADQEWCGRKPVLLVGLVGTGLSCIGSAFARSFYQMVTFRVIGGLLNGTVGIVRTMLSESIVEKRFQSRAFMLLPLAFNIAAFLGPIIAGSIASPIKDNSSSENEPELLLWLENFPYALPALVSAGMMLALALVVFLLLEETATNLKTRANPGRQLATSIRKTLRHLTGRSTYEYTTINEEIHEITDMTELKLSSSSSRSSTELHQKIEPKLPSRNIWTFNFIITLFAQSIFDFHMGAFTGLWALFLSNPRSTSGSGSFRYGGGLGMAIRDVGFATSILGAIGIILQVFIYPRVHDIIGTVYSYRVFSILFPVAYFAAPFLAAISPAVEPIVWIAIFFVLLVHVSGRVLVLPATIMVLNNCAPYPALLGKVHGFGQMASAIFRTLGPFCAGYLYQASLELESVIFSWWIVGGLAVVGFVAAQFVRDGPMPTAAEVDEEAL